jgi:hypothetical protein
MVPQNAGFWGRAFNLYEPPQPQMLPQPKQPQNPQPPTAAANPATSTSNEGGFYPGMPATPPGVEWQGQYGGTDVYGSSGLPGGRINQFSDNPANLGRGGSYGLPAQGGPPVNPLSPGNIDLHARPVVHNQDGTISTVRSMSINVDGKEVLIPTVSPDGKILDDRQAVDLFRRTGKHLGIFRTPEEATNYAQWLHTQQAQEYSGSGQGRGYAQLGPGDQAPLMYGLPAQGGLPAVNTDSDRMDRIMAAARAGNISAAQANAMLGDVAQGGNSNFQAWAQGENRGPGSPTLSIGGPLGNGYNMPTESPVAERLRQQIEGASRFTIRSPKQAAALAALSGAYVNAIGQGKGQGLSPDTAARLQWEQQNAEANRQQERDLADRRYTSMTPEQRARLNIDAMNAETNRKRLGAAKVVKIPGDPLSGVPDRYAMASINPETGEYSFAPVEIGAIGQPGAPAQGQPQGQAPQGNGIRVGQTATNPKTGQQVRWDGKQWQPIQ